MRIDEKIHKAFLEEISALENFRVNYASIHPSAPLDRDDPDVRRLMETMAFFNARSRLAAEKHILALRRRLFRQYFDYLLSPMPVAGLMQAQPTAQLADTLSLPRGTQFLAVPPDGRQAFFSTLTDLSLMPVSLSGLTTLYRPDRGTRVLLRLGVPYPRSDSIGTLRIHINYLNDFKDSLRVLHALSKHLVHSSVVYDEAVNETTSGRPCSVTFGLEQQNPGEDQADHFSHPIEKERLLIHFPQQQLFMNIKVAPSPRPWSTATLCLDLDENWPANLNLNRGMFQLHVVPVVNLKRDLAQPIICQGTKEQHGIFHHMPEAGFCLHSVRGVYESGPNGFIPLRSGTFMGGSGSYEVDFSSQNDTQGVWLLLNYPEAFEDKKQISVDALWHQPWLSEVIDHRLRIFPFSRMTTGVKWEWAAFPVPHRENPYLKHYDDFSQLITLKNKTMYNMEDVKLLLNAAGVSGSEAYHEAAQQLKEVFCLPSPGKASHKNGMVKQIYQFSFTDDAQLHEALIQNFAGLAQRILDVWIADTAVEVETTTGIS